MTDNSTSILQRLIAAAGFEWWKFLL